MTVFDPTHPLVQQWQTIVDILARMLKVRSAIITQAHNPEIEVLRASGNDGNPYRQGLKAVPSGHYCQTVIEEKRRLHVVDARTDPDWQQAPEIKYDMVSYLGYPIAWPDGSAFGTICVLDDKANTYGDEFDDLLRQFRSVVESHLQVMEQNSLLQQQLDEIRTLRAIIPICAHCKQVRDDNGYWQQVEAYFHHHTQADFSHTICPNCRATHYPELQPRQA